MFTFTLQPLLDHRAHLEDVARAEFARCLSYYETARETLAALEVQLRRAASQGRLADLQYAALSLDLQRVAVSGGRALVDEARAALTAASTARQAVETLRNRQRKAFNAKRRRRESRDLDESNARLPARSGTPAALGACSAMAHSPTGPRAR